ncbi:endonuclease III [Thermocrinis ruber]|uniref:Endonuclease III n=1 Tax=Thermocrinis ruber TaxID=75906 RepID=W0DFE7_9AQUI|nr:endonuclease III [Thermocrinis ruber]AHE95977.1 endonuclease III [Thermocrinis ruber]
MVEEIIKRLEKVFPDKLELNFSTPFELVVAVVLSAQERDAKVNEVTKELFKKFNTPQQFANASLEEIEKEISSISFYRKKAEYIKKISQILVEKYEGEVPKSIEELEKLPGIGRKSANMILYNAFGINEGIAVDRHVLRVSQRLGLTKQQKPEKAEQELMKLVPKDQWGKFSNLLILLGRYICTAQKPKHSECPLYDLCPSREL